MAKRKAKSEGSVAFNLTLPGRLARRLDREHEKALALNPLLFISRSAFLAYCLSEFIACLDDPERDPTLPKGTRVRTRPAVKPALRTGPATRKRIRLRRAAPGPRTRRGAGVQSFPQAAPPFETSTF